MPRVEKAVPPGLAALAHGTKPRFLTVHCGYRQSFATELHGSWYKNKRAGLISFARIKDEAAALKGAAVFLQFSVTPNHFEKKVFLGLKMNHSRLFDGPPFFLTRNGGNGDFTFSHLFFFQRPLGKPREIKRRHKETASSRASFSARCIQDASLSSLSAETTLQSFKRLLQLQAHHQRAPGPMQSIHGDGISDHFFELLWQKDELNFGPSVQVELPDVKIPWGSPVAKCKH